MLTPPPYPARRRSMRVHISVACAAVALLAVHALQAVAQDDPMQWPCYGRDPGGMRHSPLVQITPANAKNLQVAWTYRTGELERVKNTSLAAKVAFECTPLVNDGVLYLTTATARVIALDAASGKELWTYDPKLNVNGIFGEGASRGVSFWRSSTDPKQRRLFLGTLDARCIAIDADTGRPCEDFGNHGTIDLAAGLANTVRGLYAVTSPPAIVGDAVIFGSSIADNQRFDTSSGVVRALDAQNGRLLWNWDPIPRQAGDPGAETWHGEKAFRTGAANVWSIISADVERGLVFLPTSCPSPDFYGGERLGNNRFANSVVALEAATGRLVWDFQVVHHDIWDYDIAAQPVLFSLRRAARRFQPWRSAPRWGTFLSCIGKRASRCLGSRSVWFPSRTSKAKRLHPRSRFRHCRR